LWERRQLAVGTVCGADQHGTKVHCDASLKALVRFDVVLWRDNDDGGRNHMQAHGAALVRLGCKSVRWLSWPEAPPKGDAADFEGTETDLSELISRAGVFVAPVPAFRTGDEAPASAWANAKQVDDFLNSTDAQANWLVDNILARESITILASPRGLGKTHLSYWLAINLARRGSRGLIIDRDNPKAEIKRRLKAWGAAGLAEKLKIIARDEAPPLTDKAAWAVFPYADYDFVILDSISAATEGVEEKDGGKAGAGLAPLLDAARRGPAVLLLANTTKDGLKVRGSGTLTDRADIVYEVRDATDLKLEAKHQVWWDALPDSGEHTWGERAKRRRRRDSYRLALVVSKFRLAEEPNPIAFDLHHNTDPWSASDVTAEVEQQLEDAKRQASDAEQAKIDDAVAALQAALPLVQNPDALSLLEARGLSRNTARRLIKDRAGRDWVLVGSGVKNDPYKVDRLARNGALQTPSLPMPQAK
jgi:hypothetical protein